MTSLLLAVLVCVALLAITEIARRGAARVLGVSGGRIAKFFVGPRGGRWCARVAAIVVGSLVMYLGGAALAFAFFRSEGVRIPNRGYRVDEAIAGYPAAGKFERGDRIVAVNGEPIGES